MEDTVTPSEVWLPIPEYEGLYEASDAGRIRSLDHVVPKLNRWKTISLTRYKGRVLKPLVIARGYLRVQLCRDGSVKKFGVHVAVGLAFHGPCPDGMESRHLNGIPGDCRPSNLAWGTAKENQADRIEHGTSHRGVQNPRAVVGPTEVEAIRNSPRRSDRSLAAEFGISPSQIRNIRHGVSWPDVAGPITAPGQARKLTPEQVQEIRDATGPQRTIGHRFGVSQMTISLIKRGISHRRTASI